MNGAEINEIENRNNRKLTKQKMLQGRKAVLLALNHILLETNLKIHMYQVLADLQNQFFTSQKSS